MSDKTTPKVKAAPKAKAEPKVKEPKHEHVFGYYSYNGLIQERCQTCGLVRRSIKPKKK